jgi:hypothetical protein
MTGKVALAAALTATLTLAACDDDVEPPLSQKTITFTEQETENFGFADNPPRRRLQTKGRSTSRTAIGGFEDSHLQPAGRPRSRAAP